MNFQKFRERISGIVQIVGLLLKKTEMGQRPSVYWESHPATQVAVIPPKRERPVSMTKYFACNFPGRSARSVIEEVNWLARKLRQEYINPRSGPGRQVPACEVVSAAAATMATVHARLRRPVVDLNDVVAVLRKSIAADRATRARYLAS